MIRESASEDIGCEIARLLERCDKLMSWDTLGLDVKPSLRWRALKLHLRVQKSAWRAWDTAADLQQELKFRKEVTLIISDAGRDLALDLVVCLKEQGDKLSEWFILADGEKPRRRNRKAESKVV